MQYVEKTWTKQDTLGKREQKQKHWGMGGAGVKCKNKYWKRKRTSWVSLADPGKEEGKSNGGRDVDGG